eukprot:Skav222796  [mRNA]  locus=scaffold1419:230275:240942:+ [translate_table: standard]
MEWPIPGEEMALEAEGYRTAMAQGLGTGATMAGLRIAPYSWVQSLATAVPFPNLHGSLKKAIGRSHLFHVSESGLTLALVNLKPLVVPRRIVPRMEELTEEDVYGAAILAELMWMALSIAMVEFADLFRSVRLVQAALERVHGAEASAEQLASRLGIQDGVDAGQTVPHVHVGLPGRGMPGQAAGLGKRLPPAPLDLVSFNLSQNANMRGRSTMWSFDLAKVVLFLVLTRCASIQPRPMDILTPSASLDCIEDGAGAMC